MSEIEFLREFPRSRERSRLVCTEIVAAHWRTALSGLDGGRYRSMLAHLREAVIAAAGSPGQAHALTTSVDPSWSSRQRDVYADLLDPSKTAPLDVWMLFRAAFDAIAAFQRRSLS